MCPDVIHLPGLKPFLSSWAFKDTGPLVHQRQHRVLALDPVSGICQQICYLEVIYSFAGQFTKYKSRLCVRVWEREREQHIIRFHNERLLTRRCGWLASMRLANWTSVSNSLAKCQGLCIATTMEYTIFPYVPLNDEGKSLFEGKYVYVITSFSIKTEWQESSNQIKSKSMTHPTGSWHVNGNTCFPGGNTVWPFAANKKHWHMRAARLMAKSAAR